MPQQAANHTKSDYESVECAQDAMKGAFSLRAARGEGGRRPDEGSATNADARNPSPQPSPLIR